MEGVKAKAKRSGGTAVLQLLLALALTLSSN